MRATILLVSLMFASQAQKILGNAEVFLGSSFRFDQCSL